MAVKMHETWLTVDLNALPEIIPLKGGFFTQDNKANLVGAQVYERGQPAALTGTVTGYIIKADGETVSVPGTLSGNRASIVLPANAYTVPGQIAIAIKLADGSGTAAARTTLCACTASVRRSSTDQVVTPEYRVLDLETLLTKLAAMEAAESAANTAAANADSKAAAADTAAGAANTAAAGANTARDRANAAAAAIEGLTGGTASRLAPDAAPTVQVATQDGHYVLNVGIPQGIQGDTGPAPAIVSTAVSYQEGTSAAAVPQGAWLPSLPADLTPGRYLWVRTVKQWSNGQETTEYGVSRQGLDGSGAVSTVSLGSGSPIGPDAGGNVALPVDSAPMADSPNPISSGAVASAMQNALGTIQENFVAKAGDTMSGNLSIQKDTPGVYFKKPNASDMAASLYQIVDSADNNRFVLMQRVDGSVGAEGYFLPVPDSHDAFTVYGLLTTKSAVTVSQGGTGAATAAAARANLGLADLIDHDDDATITWLSAADTYVDANTRVCRFYRRGKLCLVNMNIRLKAGAFTSSVTLGTIPEGYRPLFISRGIWLISPYSADAVATNSRVQFAFETGGNFTMMHAEGTAGFVRGILVYALE